MKLSGAIQEALLAVVAFDPQGAPEVLGILKAEDFDLIYRDFYREVVDYRKEYGQVPGEHLLDLSDKIEKSLPKHKDSVRSLYKSIVATKGEINRDYVLKQAKLFARLQGMRRAIGQALDNLEKGDEIGVLEAETLLGSASRQAAEFGKESGGTFLHDPLRSLRFLDERSKPFKLGIQALDERGLGLARKRLLVLAGPPKSGKSWFLIHLGKMAHLQSLRVLYLTMELSEDEVCQRFIQSFYAIQKRKAKTFRTDIIRDENGRMTDFQIQELGRRPRMTDRGIRKVLERKLEGLKNRSRLLVHEFPTSSLSVPEVEILLDNLEQRHHFIPDVVLVDYPDLMRPTTKSKERRHELREIFEGLRGIAGRRDLAMAAVTQTSRSSKSAKIVTELHVAEDWSKIMTADLVLTYSQTMQERELGLARLFVAAGRTDGDRFQVLVTQNYSLGQFAQDSAYLAPNYWNLVENREAEEEEEEEED